MNFIDYIIVFIVFFSLLNGYKNGLIAELASTAALILGIWGAIHFSQITAEQLIRYFNWQTTYLPIISFAITFIIIVILVHILANAVSKMVEPSLLGVFDKMGGVIIGLLRVLLFLSVTLMIFDKIDSHMNFIPDKAKKESQMYESIKNLVPSFFPFIDLWNQTDEPEKPEKNAVA